jgi:hypothetical protein
LLLSKNERTTAILSYLDFIGINVSHHIFVKPEIERLRISSHLKVAKRYWLFYGDIATDSIWFGNNSNKGLGIISNSNFRFKLFDLHNSDFKNVLPLAVTGGKTYFTLFGILANNSKDPDGR